MSNRNNNDAELAAARKAFQETRKAISYGTDYDLSKLAYLEWQERANQFSEPIQLPAFVRRLLTALRGMRGKPAPEADAYSPQQSGRAGAAAK